MLCGLGHGLDAGRFLFRGEVFPEERDTESTVGPLEGFVHTFLVVDVRGDHLRSESCQRFGLLRVYVPRDCACDKAARGVVHDRANQAATLGPGRA